MRMIYDNAKPLNMQPVKRFGIIMPLLAALWCMPAAAQSWKVNLREADITAFIAEVADITGRSFVVDPRVKGNVTVVSNRALSREQVYDLFLGVMNVNGVVAVPSGNTVKLMPDINARQGGLGFDPKARVNGEQMVTQIIWLDNTAPNDLLPALRPLLPQSAQIATINGVNALVVSDRAANIAELQRLVKTLDGNVNERLEIINLKNTQAEDILSLIEAMSIGGISKDNHTSRLKVIADPRSNRILVRGDTRSQQKIRDIVRQLDVVPAQRLGGVRVFPLKQASAKNMAEMLRSLMNNTSMVSSAPTSTLTPLTDTSTGSTSTATTGTTTQTPTSNNNNSLSSGSSSSTKDNKATQNVSIIADESQNALVVKADPSLMREIEATIAQLDSPRAQVLIQAAIIEVSGDDLDQLGVQWALGNASTGYGLINFDNAGTSLTNLYSAVASKNPSLVSGLAGALLGLGKSTTSSNGKTNFFGAILQALKNTTHADLRSVPSVITLDNEEADLVVGQNVPFITGSTTTTSGGITSPYNTITRQDVGISLKVIPHVGQGDNVRLEVSQEVSSLVPTVSSIKSADLITNKRLIKTTVVAQDQHTIALGGLMQDDSTNSVSAVPGLSKLPWVGGLFRARSRDNTKRNLLVFLQPTIIRSAERSNTVTQGRYAQIRSLQFELDPYGELSRLPVNIEDMYGNGPAHDALVITPRNLTATGESVAQNRSQANAPAIIPPVIIDTNPSAYGQAPSLPVVIGVTPVATPTVRR